MRRACILPTVLVILVTDFCSGIPLRQSIAVKGVLRCGDAPAFGVRVRLLDKDIADLDETLATQYADKDGHFEVKGDTVELTRIDPKVNVYHDCNDGTKPGQRKFIFTIPKHYITRGPTPEKVFDLGVVNLEMKPYKEERKFGKSKRSFETVGCDKCTITSDDYKRLHVDIDSPSTTETTIFHNLDVEPDERNDPY